MSYIYQITNIVNGKQYIGKTEGTIEERWKQHCKSYKRINCEKRPLYSAMKKYGLDSFVIIKLEECLPQDSNEKEKYWIEILGTFKKGYNATIGGDGALFIDYDLVVENYKHLKNQTSVAELMNITTDSVRKILKIKHISILTSKEVNINRANTINMFDKNNKFIRSFASAKDVGRFLIINNNYTQANLTSISTNVGRVCKGKRKTCMGFIWGI
jgi:group I intron endonuclease